MSRSTEFQFAHPRGVRPFSYFTLLIRQPFQFTHLRGVRPSCNDFVIDGTMFQFTHLRGVRRALFKRRARLRQFQFTHPRGVRHSAVAVCLCVHRVSIHAPARGATLCSTACRPTRSFNLRTREGCDGKSADLYGFCKRVSIYAPARGATFH